MRFKAIISLSLSVFVLLGLTVPPLLAEKEMTKKEKRQAEREAERQKKCREKGRGDKEPADQKDNPLFPLPEGSRKGYCLQGSKSKFLAVKCRPDLFF